MQQETVTHDDGLVEIKVTAEAKDVAEVKIEALQQLGQDIQVKGFRKGKAPPEIAEKHISKDALVEQIINLLVHRAYHQAVEAHQLNPITNPTVEIPTLKGRKKDQPLSNFLWPQIEKEGLEFKLHVIVKPQFELGDWRKVVASVRTGKVIETAATLTEAKRKVTEEKTKTAEESKKRLQQTPKEQDTKLVEQILDTLVESVKIKIPEELVNREITSQILHQAQQVSDLGMKYEDYLKSQGKDIQKVQEELKPSTQKQVKLRFILPKIAEDLGITLREEADFGQLFEELKGIAKKSSPKKQTMPKPSKRN